MAKRKTLDKDEVAEVTRMAGGAVAKSFEDLYKAFPEVSKVALKKLGNELKLAGVWVPRQEKKKEKKKDNAGKDKAQNDE